MTCGNISPKLRRKSPLSFIHSDLHIIGSLCHSLCGIAHIVMGTVSLITSPEDDRSAPSGGNGVQIPGKNRMPLMVSHIGTQTDTDHKGSDQGNGIALQIFHRRDNITFGISRHSVRYQVKLSQIILGLPQLYNGNICLRRCPGKNKSSSYGTSRRDTGKCGSVTVLIVARYDFPRIIT